MGLFSNRDLTLEGLLHYVVATISRFLKITGLFCKSYRRDHILQKRPKISRSLLVVATT